MTGDPTNRSRETLSVSSDAWPFPVPIVQKKGRWHFDSKEVHNEILRRRIDANELDAIQICRGFVDEQEEYASEIHGRSGVNQYSQKIISAPGKHDGLYWQNEDGTPGGPISDGDRSSDTGRLRTRQDLRISWLLLQSSEGTRTAAPLVQLDHVIEGVMIGGFASVAAPAEYRVTGIKTFMVSYDGDVYQKDVGPDTLEVFQGMEWHNPDKKSAKTAAAR